MRHFPGDNHPESPARLTAVLAALDDPRFALLERIDAPRATREQLTRVHRGEYIDHLLANEPYEGRVWLDPDTLVSSGSNDAALHAAGAVCAAVDGAFAGWKRRAFCAIRPPGHHARPSAAMGFCLFNNIAVGAAHAIATQHLDRVAIIDFDAHHGNGTQEIFWCDPRVMYASTHQSTYPGSGAREEIGVGNMLNVPLSEDAKSVEFRDAYEDVILPALEDFAPQLVMISAGFDAHHLDPLGGLALETEDFSWITYRLLDIAQRYAHGRVVSSLEGGYNLNALRECVVAHVSALMG
jgi:acetoin utilization deacetylase AcuC-like enzyme